MAAAALDGALAAAIRAFKGEAGWGGGRMDRRSPHTRRGLEHPPAAAIEHRVL